MSSDGTCVLDKETGLVWERSPSSKGVPYTWADAVEYAYRKTLGGRKGWRLPTIEELASLVDYGQRDPSLPPDNPFKLVDYGIVGYWTVSTINASDPHLAWKVFFHDGFIDGEDKSHGGYVWCVRGGHAYDH
ncbi:MAG: DUF1566 domain-containing protein [Planctomycetota bacterium]|nr:DUF1566 domain-containing protein [Planctomycetota bacterium]